MISTVDHRRIPLLEALFQQAHKTHSRFYMPGHKGGKGCPAQLLRLFGYQGLKADIPELPQLDQLFAPTGVIQEAQVLAAEAFGADETYFLINGSSVGLMATLMTVCRPGEQVIIPRNCHQSIVHGLILSGAHPIWIYPPLDLASSIPFCITPSQLKVTLEKFPNAKGAIAVSPTYEGICGDIKGLAAIAHHHNIPLIVDEAHGGHFGFHPDLPPSALSQGADLVVQSTHKVLGALTQSSMLHVKGDRINRDLLKKNLAILQTSSPNYLLLASLDAARSQMACEGELILDEAIKIAAIARTRLQSLLSIQLLTQPFAVQSIDPLRLTLLTSRTVLSGFELDDILHQDYGIVAELPAEEYVCFVLGQGNSLQEIETLCDALESVESRYPRIVVPTLHAGLYPNFEPDCCVMPQYSPREIHYSKAKTVKAEDAIGQISHDLICPYPPGIPLICAGETITLELVTSLRNILNRGGTVIGPRNPSLESFEIVEQP